MLIKKEECNESLETVSKCECLLCLRVANVADCVLFNETHKKILEGLLAKEVTNGLGSVVCNNCINTLDQSFAFKSTCLHTEDNLTSLITSENFSKLDIITVFREAHKDKRELLSKDSKVCRFCLKILEKISYTFLKDLNDPDLEMLEKVMPEVQLEAVKDPIICEVCLYCFRDVLEFINKCLNAQKWCDKSNWTNLNINLDHRDGDGGNLITSEADSGNLREPDDGSILNAKEIKWEPDLFESSDTTCLKNDHVSDDEESSQSFKCHDCDFVTMDEDSLAVHTNVHNSSDIKLESSEECTIQREHQNPLSLQDLLKLEKPEVGQLYKCQLCQYSTKYKYHLKRHYVIHKTPDKVKRYKCQLCEFSTNYQSSLKTHQKVHKDPDKIQWYKCQSCQFSTKHKNYLKKHKLLHEKLDEAKLYKCQLCQFSTNYRRNLKSHQVMHEDPDKVKWYKCHLCQFSTKYKHSFVNHKIVHEKPDKAKLYKCPSCQFSTNYKMSFTNHQLAHENSDKVRRHKCQLCQFSTNYQSSLITHQIVHKDPDKVQWYMCQLCQFKTKCQSRLVKHQVMHDKAKLHKCQLCRFSTSLKRSLTRHQLVHKTPEEAKLYKCQLCQYSTNYKESLKNHQALHEDDPDKVKWYKCHLCQFSTKHKRSLGPHKLQHEKSDKAKFSTKYKNSFEDQQIVHEEPEEAKLLQVAVASVQYESQE